MGASAAHRMVDASRSHRRSAVAAALITGNCFGAHRLRVRYYQLGGWSELRLEVVRN